MNARPNEDGSIGASSGGEGIGADVGLEAAEPAAPTELPAPTGLSGSGGLPAPAELSGSVGLSEPQPAATRLRRSRHLLRMSESAPALSRLYSRGALLRSIGQVSWRIQWRCVTESFTGVELRLRWGDADVLVGLETLATFGAAADLKAGVPAGLHVAYLTGLGAEVWRQLEVITARPVQVLGIRLDARLEVNAESLGFEIGRDPEGATSRGFLQLIDADPSRNAELERLVLEVSRREMPEAPARTDLPVLWAAVVGQSRLTAGEVQGLEEHDIVILDDTRPTSNMLNCRLCVGPTRLAAGRVQWSHGGQLQMVQFDGIGESKVSAQIEVPVNPQGKFEEIPVNLRFELAQWTASLGEIGSLAPGTVLDLGQPLDGHAVSIWVEQRCIGKGQLVAIGERLGVRLLSVFAREHV